MTITDRRRLFLRADGLFAVPGADGEGGDGGAPDPHAATHEDGGSDEIAIAQSQVIGLEAALAGKPDTGDPPTAHHATHEPGGSDALAVDAAAAVGSLRTLGTGANQAAPGNDARFGGAPAAHATTHQPGGADAMAVDAVAATGSLRTLGTGAQQAAAGNDSRLTNARTPTAHATSHQPGGADAMAVDAVAATGSLRTLGTSATSACAGNDSRLTNARTPTAHATTHEPGGSDALTALDASTLTTGTLPDARLSANVARRDQYNVYTASGAEYQSAAPYLGFIETDQPANQRIFALYGNNQTFGVYVNNDAGASLVSPMTMDRQGNTFIGANLYEKGRLTALGHWQDVPFSAANFAASAPMTWTVASGNHVTNRYALVGKTLIWAVAIVGSTLSGTASGQLAINLPPGMTAAATMGGGSGSGQWGGTWGPIMVHATAGQPYVNVFTATAGVFVIGTLALHFTLTLEIQ